MSVFSGADPIAWLQEKTLRALHAAILLVDLANEPDTTSWYKRKLLSLAEQLIDRLAPLVAFLYHAGQEAADRKEWGPMLESGSFALGRWCKRWKITDPHNIASGSIRHLKTVDEDDEKAQEIFPEPFDDEDWEGAYDLKLQIYSYMSRRLLDQDLSEAAHKMLLWMMSSLWISYPPDMVAVSKRFLPTDIGITPVEAKAAYKSLYDNGLIERVHCDDAETRDRLLLRLVVRGLNDSKHALQFEEIEFGFPGARIDGKVTMGQGKFIELPKTLSSMLGRWFKEPQVLTQLRDFLQEKIGNDRAYIESAEIDFRKDDPVLLVHFRFPLDADNDEIEEELTVLAEDWLKSRLHT